MKKCFRVAIMVILASALGKSQDAPPPDESFKSLDVQPTIASRANPTYPKEALSKNLEGTV